MKRSLTVFILFLGMSFLFSSCGTKEATDAAGKTANKFFTLLIKGDNVRASNFVEPSFDSRQQLEEIARLGKNDANGKLISAKKSFGFNTQIMNGVATVTLPYQLKYERNELSVQVTLVGKGSRFKIRSIH